jgi:hypothetical protein
LPGIWPCFATCPEPRAPRPLHATALTSVHCGHNHCARHRTFLNADCNRSVTRGLSDCHCHAASATHAQPWDAWPAPGSSRWHGVSQAVDGRHVTGIAKARRNHGVRRWRRSTSEARHMPAASLRCGPPLPCIARGVTTKRRATASAAARSASAQRFVGQIGVTGQPCFQCIAQFLRALGR